MSDLFANLIGRSAGAGLQLRPLHPLYRGEGAVVSADVVDAVSVDPSPLHSKNAAFEPRTASPRREVAPTPPPAFPSSKTREQAIDLPLRGSPVPGLATASSESESRPTPEIAFLRESGTQHVPIPSPFMIELPVPASVEATTSTVRVLKSKPTLLTASQPRGIETAEEAPPPSSSPRAQQNVGAEVSRSALRPTGATPELTTWDRSVPTDAPAVGPSQNLSVATPTASLEARAERHVSVNIGRLEVKIVPPTPGAKHAPAVEAPTSGLTEYLKRRSGGDR